MNRDISPRTMSIAAIDQQRQFQEIRPSKSCGFSAIPSPECHGAELPLPLRMAIVEPWKCEVATRNLVDGHGRAGLGEIPAFVYSYSSALAMTFAWPLPLSFWPPAMSTVPVFNKVAV